MRIGRSRLRVAVGAGLAVLGLAVLGNALSPSWEPRRLPAYGSLPPMPEPASSAGSANGEIQREDVRVPVREEVLRGTVVSPAAAGRHPAVVLVHGAGPGRRSDLIELAEHFARAGIVALVYDKRNVGYSAVTNRDFGLLAEDALVSVRLLRQRENVDPARVGLWGISEGGWVVPIAALVARRGGKPAGDDETWRRIRRLLRWLAVSGISTHLLFNLVLVASIVLALTQVGSSIVVDSSWLVVRLAALATVVLAVTGVHAAVSAAAGNLPQRRRCRWPAPSARPAFYS